MNEKLFDLPSASIYTLKFRAKLLKSIRNFFDNNEYFEVETPVISTDIVVDAHLEPITINGPQIQSGIHSHELFLQTSPEFAMKRILSSGAKSIYQISHAFRDEEWGENHNPEFSMLEWYRVGDDHIKQMEFVESLIIGLFQEFAGDDSNEISQNFERLSYDSAFEQHAASRILGLGCEEMKSLALKHDLNPPESLSDDEPDDWRNYLLAELVEPHLGATRPTFLYDYPASQAALATIRNDSPPVAERFELYLQGLEICNGYKELTDADELAQRQLEQNRKRKQLGRRVLPANNRLLEAMRRGLPECAGVALGIDRLAMILTGAQSISEVMPFPFDRC